MGETTREQARRAHGQAQRGCSEKEEEGVVEGVTANAREDTVEREVKLKLELKVKLALPTVCYGMLQTKIHVTGQVREAALAHFLLLSVDLGQPIVAALRLELGDG